MQPVEIEQLAQTDVVTVEPEMSIADVISKMAENDVGSVVVVDDGSPIGILTDRTIALALEGEPDITEKQASELIQDDGLVTATTDMTLVEALERLNEENVRRLPIVNEDGQLEGIVTLDDILVLLGSALHEATEIIKAQSPRL